MVMISTMLSIKNILGKMMVRMNKIMIIINEIKVTTGQKEVGIGAEVKSKIDIKIKGVKIKIITTIRTIIKIMEANMAKTKCI